jgi:hypothetical protein
MRYKKFSDFAEEESFLDGEKIKIDEVIDREILVTDYKVKDSKYNDSKCLKLQFSIDDKKHIIFTGSNVLIDQIEKYKDEIPFLTIIKKINKYYTFT